MIQNLARFQKVYAGGKGFETNIAASFSDIYICPASSS